MNCIGVTNKHVTVFCVGWAPFALSTVSAQPLSQRRFQYLVRLRVLKTQARVGVCSSHVC